MGDKNNDISIELQPYIGYFHHLECNLPSNNVFAIGKNFTMSSFTTSSVKDYIDNDEYEDDD